ncbi:MAG TPA: hypothetical protein VN622_16850 [Clostridia bacterium]|nr:hypothetical protein [Clostridia bacterium]
MRKKVLVSLVMAGCTAGWSLLAVGVEVQAASREQKNGPAQEQKQPPAQNPAGAAREQSAAEDISGMYSFLRDGEFVQINIEEGNVVTGFVSRYGDTGSDKDTFLDQFFSKASLVGDKLTWVTKPIHDVWFEFDGAVEHPSGKTQAQEGFVVLKGKLTQHSISVDKQPLAKSREVELKSFPQELDQ